MTNKPKKRNKLSWRELIFFIMLGSIKNDKLFTKKMNKNIYKTCSPANILKEGIYIVQTVQANILL